VEPSEPWYQSARAWEHFLTRASQLELDTLHDALPQHDPGNYRLISAEVFQNNFQNALTLLEEGGSFFDEPRYAAGLHAFVRMRLGLKPPYTSPLQGKDEHAQEDAVYWHLAWSLYNAQQKDLHEARRLLFRAKALALELGMVHTLALIETVKKNLHTPHLGLPLVAPPYEVLRSPKAFDKLRQDKNSFARLAALGNEPNLDRVQVCRYAQFLLYEDQFEQALVVIEKASPQNYPLAYSIKMAIVASLEWYDTLHDMIENFRPGSSEPLEAEATVLGYEMCALYYVLVKRDYQFSYAYLHRAEALAFEHKLTYRLSVIHMHLEAVSNIVGDALPALTPLPKSDSGYFTYINAYNRYETFLRTNNIEEIYKLASQNKIGKAELLLALGTMEYQRFTRGESSIYLVAELVEKYKPEYATAQLFWSLLMIQIFISTHDPDHYLNPKRICPILENSIENIDHLAGVIPLAANLYPQGLTIASHFYPQLVYSATTENALALMPNDVQHGVEKLKRVLLS
jgi:hypothetical protein